MKNNTNFFERLELLMDHYGIDMPALVKRLGYKSGEKLYRLGRVENSKPSYDIILDFSNSFENLNLTWLITGKGEIEKNGNGNKALTLKEQDPPTYNKSKFVAPKVVTVDENGNDNIVLVPEKAAAGYLNGYGDPEFIQTLPTYKLPNLSNGTFRMFQVKGHSMYPTLTSESFVVGEWVENYQSIKDDRIYIIVSKRDGVTVKRVLNRIEKYGSLYCKSDNRKEYPSFSITPEDIIEIWEVKLYLAFQLQNPADIYDRLNDLEAKLMNLEDKFRLK